MVQLTFGASGLDRAAHLRQDAAALAAALDRGGGLAVWRGKVLLDGAGPVWLPGGHPVFARASEGAVFLGDDAGTWRFARDVSAWEPGESDPRVGAFVDPSVQVHPEAPAGAGFRELRAVMGALAPRDAELLAVARALTGWHARHRYCANCGAATAPADAGWRRHCAACGAQHFPRTDPVVIMLVTHGNDLLLGRSPGWPEGMYSLLAGFVEPGETLEAAAAREVFEESGVRLGPVSYLACQPWPFPSSLMIGVRAEAEGREITLDPAELEDARWVAREEVLAAMDGRREDLRPARPGAIARALIEDWLAGRIA